MEYNANEKYAKQKRNIFQGVNGEQKESDCFNLSQQKLEASFNTRINCVD